jgi:uncharacterized protein YcnI
VARIAAFVIVAALVALLPAPASGHVELQPPFVAANEPAVIVFVSPNERERPMTGLELALPHGVDVLEVEAPAGWQGTRTDALVRWTGGRLPPRATATFSVRLRVTRPPGSVVFPARQRFTDGEVVVWRPQLTILPGSGSDAPDQFLDRALAVAVVGLALIAASLVVVRRLRRPAAPGPPESP